ncbi:unnamed protein product, partial [Pleuronectes platessa]
MQLDDRDFVNDLTLLYLVSTADTVDKRTGRQLASIDLNIHKCVMFNVMFPSLPFRTRVDKNIYLLQSHLTRDSPIVSIPIADKSKMISRARQQDSKGGLWDDREGIDRRRAKMNATGVAHSRQTNGQLMIKRMGGLLLGGQGLFKPIDRDSYAK